MGQFLRLLFPDTGEDIDTEPRDTRMRKGQGRPRAAVRHRAEVLPAAVVHYLGFLRPALHLRFLGPIPIFRGRDNLPPFHQFSGRRLLLRMGLHRPGEALLHHGKVGFPHRLLGLLHLPVHKADRLPGAIPLPLLGDRHTADHRYVDIQLHLPPPLRELTEESPVQLPPTDQAVIDHGSAFLRLDGLQPNR